MIGAGANTEAAAEVLLVEDDEELRAEMAALSAKQRLRGARPRTRLPARDTIRRGRYVADTEPPH